MVESKNLKLKLGLCGLALTSFLAVNAHSTVHADTVSGGNANAITWDSDQDDSQVVHEDSNQEEPSQSVQTQSAVQDQKAPTTQSVQSNNQKRAETSAVRVSNFDTSAVNRNNAQNVRTQANRVKVSNVNATDAVRVTNPQNSQIVVHYVKTNGQSAGLQDQTISMSKSGNGSYSAPSGYTLAQGNGSYNVNVTSKETIPDFDVYWNNDSKMYTQKNQPYHSGEQIHFNINWDSNTKANTGATNGTLLTDDGVKRMALNLARNALKNSGQGDLLTKGTGYVDPDLGLDPDADYPMNYFNISYSPYDNQDRFMIEYGNDTFAWDAVPYVWIDPKSNNQDTSSLDKNTTDFQMAEKLKDYWSNARKQAGLDAVHDDARVTSIIDNDATSSDKLTRPEWHMFVGHVNGKQFANGDTVFTDGGSATSVVGNHINVPVTQPQSVDPNSSDCRRQAQRVIHVTFPNGVKPKSYDSITDSAGNKLTLDGNNDLVQTVTFTRSKTVDSLTGATLNQTSWQQHGAINAVTLPAIPGYTMTQTK